MKIEDFAADAQSTTPSPAPDASSVERWASGSEDAQKLNAAYQYGVRKAPEQAARTLRLSGQTGLPQDMVERNADQIEQTARMSQFDPDKFQKESPFTAQWLAEHPNHVSVAQDDLDNLKQHEMLVGQTREATSYLEDLRSGYQNSSLGLLLRRELPDLTLPENAPLIDSLIHQAGMLAGDFPAMIVGGAAGAVPGATVGAGTMAAVGTVAGPAGTVAGLAAGAIVGGAIGAGAGANAFPAALRTAILDQLKNGNPEDMATMLERIQDAAAEAGKQGVVGGLGTVANLVTGGLGGGLVAKYGGGAIAQKAVKAGALAAEVGTFTAVGKGLEGQTATGRDYLEGALLVGAMHGANAVPGYLKAVGEARRAETIRDFYRAMGDNAEASKLRERLPEAHKELVSRITENSPVENIYVPVEAMEQFFQKANVNPTIAMSELGTLKEYAEAKATGSDVKIPLSDWTEKVVGTPHYEGLASDIKFHPEDMTVNEAHAAREELTKSVQAEAQVTPEQADQSASRVTEMVSQQLVQAGFDPKTADTQAQLYSETFRSLGERSGLDPLELFERYGLRIRREGTAGEGEQVYTQDQGPRSLEVERAFNAPDLIERHAQLPGTDGGRIIDHDNIRNLHPGYAAEGREAKIIHLDETGKPAAAAAERILDERLKQEPGVVVMTAGGSGSGKTTYAQKFAQTHQDATAVFDSTAANYEAVKARIEKVLASGHEVVYDFIYSPFDQALEGNKERFKAMGRLVDPHTMAYTHASALDAFVRLQKDFAGDPRVSFGLFQRNGERFTEAPLENADKLRYNQDGTSLRSAIRKLEKQATEALKNETDEVRSTKERFAQEAGNGAGDAQADQRGSGSSEGSGLLGDAQEVSPDEVAAQKAHDQKIFEQAKFTLPDGESNVVDATELFKRKNEPDDGKVAGKVVFRNKEYFAETPEGLRHHIGDRDLGRSMLGHEVRFSINEMDDAVDVRTREGSADPLVDKQATKLLGKKLFAKLSEKGRKMLNSFAARYSGEIDKQIKAAQRADLGPYVQDNAVKGIGWIPNYATEPTGVIGEPRILEPHTMSKGNAISIDPLAWAESKYGATKELIEKHAEQKVPLTINTSSDLIGQKDYIEALPPGTVVNLHLLPKDDQLNRAMFPGNASRLRQDRAVEALREAGVTVNAIRPTFESVVEAAGGREKLNELFNERDGAGHGDVPDQGWEQALRRSIGRDLRVLNQDARGRIRFGEQRQFNIDLLHNADLSTFLHESGHFYLEVLGDLAEQSGAESVLGKDYDTVLKWLGVDSREKIGVDQHEQFARGFEAYLMEGKAPSSALRKAFAKMRSWLVSIYRQMKNLNVELTPEVREVFDRMVATDDAIEAANREMNYKPLFNDPKVAGMSEQKAFDYIAATAEAKQVAEEQLNTKMMAQVRREQTKAFKAQRENVRAEIEKEINERPAYRALEHLQFGREADGSPLPDGVEAIKLSKKDIVNDFGKETLQGLPKPYVYSAEGGVHPDVAAEAFGFSSGKDLLQSLWSAEKKRDLVERLTDEKMRTDHADLAVTGEIPKEALKAVHNEKRAQLLRMELEHLASNNLPVLKEVVRRVTRKVPDLAQVREQAEAMITAKKTKDINPLLFQRAEIKASKDAVEQTLKGDLDKAFEAKQKELLNHELWRAASKAQEDVEKTLKYMRKFSKETKRAQLGRTDYLGQIDSILSRFEFTPITTKELLAREHTLAEFIAEKQRLGESFGEEIFASDVLKNEDFKTNYKNLTHEEIMGIRDTVKQIEHLAIKADQMLYSERKQRFADAKAELLNSAIANLRERKAPALSRAGETFLDRAGKTLRGLDAAQVKAERIIRMLDGDDIRGAWHEHIFNRASEAQTAERDYTHKITAQLAKVVETLPKEMRKSLRDKVEIPGIDRTITRKDLFAVALNSGNESNYRKMRDGMKWTDEQVGKMLDMLKPEELKVVQGIFDTLEGLWPDIAKLQKELTGLVPDKIEARKIKTANGEISGGYYPLMYDSSYSAQGLMQLTSDVGGKIEGGYVRATTPKSHTKARVEGFSAPIDFNLERLPNHIAGVIKDLTHRKWLIDTNRLLNDRDIRAEVTNRLGPEYLKNLDDMVKTVVNSANQPNMASLGTLDRFINQTRSNATIVALGFKFSTMLAQAADVTNAVDSLGGKDLDGVKYASVGLARFLRNPLSLHKEVTELSGEMRHRFESRDTNMGEQLRLLDDQKDFVGAIKQTSMYGVHMAAMGVELPIWWGGYSKGLEKGFSESEAIHFADSAVRMAFGAHGGKDKAPIVASNDKLLKAMTMFFSPFSALYSKGHELTGQGFEAVRDINEADGAGQKLSVAKDRLSKLAFRTLLVWTIPATLGPLLVGQTPSADADSDEWAKWWAQNQALYPFMAIAGLRDVAAGVAQGGYGYQMSPLAQAGKATAGAVSSSVAYAKGDKELEDAAKSLYRASGYWLGLPTGQVEITGKYINDLYNGDEQPESVGEFARNMLLRRQPQK